MDKKSEARFLNIKGLNSSFKIKGLNFDGTLIELLREYRQLLLPNKSANRKDGS